MSEIMEDQSVHDSKIYVFTEVSSIEMDKPKVAEMTKGKSRMPGRKALANVSNTQQGFTASNQDHNAGPSSDVLRKHIEQLQKEKAALMKHIADKNKVIELGGTEMQKLRVTLEKLKQQNLHLAQSNSQMLTEVNSVKERQKALNHEIGCKNSLIIAKNLELEHIKVTEPEETKVCTLSEGDDDKHDANNMKQISKSLVHSNKTIQEYDKGNIRPQRRRHSAKFKFDDVPCSSSNDRDHDHDDDDRHRDREEERKTSVSRPVREAAKRVQSYKEVNLVVKMRRE